MNGEGSLFDVPPAAFGRYHVLQQLGAGTTGPVFRGEDSDTHAPVAIKVLRMNLPASRAAEVSDGLLALVRDMPPHPAIAAPLASGLDEHDPYLVSRFTAGQPLDAAIREFGPAAIEDLVPRLRELAEALDEAATAGFVHGSLHPSDIVVAEEDTIVTGLGVAPLLAKAGVAIPRRKPYVAPEILGGGNPSAAADQFALAAITYEWLFGESIQGPAEARIEVSSMPVANGEALSDAFTTALAADPQERFESATAFADAVSASLREVPKEEAEIDVPLREEPVVESSPRFAAIEEPDKPVEPEPVEPVERVERVEPAMFSRAPKPPERFGGGMLVFMLIIGLVAGFAAGYMATPRALQHPILATPSQPAPTPAAAAAPATAPPPAATEAKTAASAPAKKESTAPIAEAAPGRLLIRSTPSGASVSVDGISKGVTPLALRDLPLGARKVVITSRGYIAEEQRVMLTKARPSRSLEVRLAAQAQGHGKPAVATAKPAPAPSTPAAVGASTGVLVVDSRPIGASVSVDGKPSGTTPLTIDAVAAGDHKVTLQLSGYQPFSTTVRVVAGTRVRAAASLSVQEKE